MGNRYTERKKAQRKRKKERERMNNPWLGDIGMQMVYSVPTNSLDTLQTVSEAQCEPKKEKTKMFTSDSFNNQPVNIEATQRNYLLDEVISLNSEHIDDVREKFNQNEPSKPKTAKALVDAILAGNYTLPKEHDTEYNWKDPVNRIVWRSPDAKPDDAGYEAAMKALETAYVSVQDAVVLKPLDEALKAKEDFAKWIPTGATN